MKSVLFFHNIFIFGLIIVSWIMVFIFNLAQKLNKNVLTLTRSLMTTTMNLEKTIDNLKTNPYYEKYAERIAALQKTSEKKLVFEEAEKPEKKTKEEGPVSMSSIDTRQYSSVLNPKQPAENIQNAEDVKLETIFKLDLVKNKNAAEIQAIWEEYHKNKEVISATIPSKLYNEMLKKIREYSTFIFPLPRSQGYEFIMCQCLRHSAHFTPLLAYQVHKENAPECLKMVHYTELSEKGIILMRGEYDKNVLTSKEAQCLANQFQMYYNGHDEVKINLLKQFTKQPESFKHMDLIAQLESITLTGLQ